MGTFGATTRRVLTAVLISAAGFACSTLAAAVVIGLAPALGALREVMTFGYGIVPVCNVALVIAVAMFNRRLQTRTRSSEQPNSERAGAVPDTTSQRVEGAATRAETWDDAWRSRRLRFPTSEIEPASGRSERVVPDERDSAITVTRATTRGRDDLQQAQFIADFIVFPEGEPWPPDCWRDAAHTLVTGAILHVLHGCERKSLASVVELLDHNELNMIEIVELIMCGPQFADLPSMVVSFEELAEMGSGPCIGLERVFTEAIERVRQCVAPASSVLVEAAERERRGGWLRTTRRDIGGPTP